MQLRHRPLPNLHNRPKKIVSVCLGRFQGQEKAHSQTLATSTQTGQRLCGLLLAHSSPYTFIFRKLPLITLSAGCQVGT